MIQKTIITNEKEALEVAQKLEGITFSHLNIPTTSNKGLTGNILENIFGLTNDNSPKADFYELGFDTELKTTPIKKLKNNNYSAKERLSLQMIEYNDDFDDEFLGSKVFDKIKNTLVINYLLNNDGLKEIAKSWILWFEDDELEIIQKDYEIIINKIKNGKAHELSDSDTIYLGASRKGHNENPRTYRWSKTPAKSRAWSFKTTFMTRKTRFIYNNIKLEIAKSSQKVFINSVINEILKYKGKTIEEINKSLNRPLSKNKSRHRFAIDAILSKSGISKDKLSNNNIFIKVQKENKKGNRQESISFPNVEFYDFINWDFEQTEIYQYMSQGILNVLWTNDWKLKNVKKIKFKNERINIARNTFNEIKKSIGTEKVYLVRESDDKVIHLRPKGRNGNDKIILPNGQEIVKQSLWINKKELN